MNCNYWGNLYKKEKTSLGKTGAHASATNGNLNKNYLRSLDYQLNSDKRNLLQYLEFFGDNNCY